MSNDEDFSSERLQGIKSAIHRFLASSNVYSSIRDIVDSYVVESEGKGINPNNINDLMRVIKEKGIIQQLLGQLHSEISNKPQNFSTPSLHNHARNEYFLHVRLNGGKAFVDNLSVPASSLKRYAMLAAFQFGYQRYLALPKECTSNPNFNDDFLFQLDATLFGFSSENLIEISTPFHIAVARADVHLNTSVLIGENIIDWRKVLKTGYLGLTVELCGRNAGIPAGILDMQLELISQKKIRYDEKDISKRLEQQREAITAADREFLIYARRWWADYTHLSEIHKSRKVKLFANSSTGRMVPLTHFVTPLQAVYGLTSPQSALRFVSLFKTLGVDEDSSFFPQETPASEVWLPGFIFLLQKQGHPCNHASLLCSLLLGFGLDAYCAIGTGASNATFTFVLTRCKTHSGALDVTIWDPVAGEKVRVYGSHPFQTIDCVFNHKAFFSNCQRSNNMSHVLFDFDNEEYWKSLNPLKIRLVPKYPTSPLLYLSIVRDEIEKTLERDLRALLVHERDAIGQLTYFDDNLSYVLVQALDMYENQRVMGKTEDFSLFELCVKGSLGPGKTFKAIPVNVAHTCDTQIFSALKASDSGKEIIETIGEDVKFAIRARVFPFPEGIRSVWALVAVEYRMLS